MRYARLALGGLLWASPLLSPAQTYAQLPVEPAAAPRFYVGLGAYHSNYLNLAVWRPGDTGFRVPVQLTAGYQLRPRLALELDVAYRGHTSDVVYDDYYAATSGAPPLYSHYAASFTQRTTAVSALARYAFTRKPAHRLKAEALAGFTLIHEAFDSRGASTDNLSGSPQTTSFANSRSYNDLLLTAGLGLRYRLCSRLALNFDFSTNYNLTHPTPYNTFNGSSALGLRYRFGH